MGEQRTKNLTNHNKKEPSQYECLLLPGFPSEHGSELV